MTPPSGPSTCSSLVMGYPSFLPSYPLVLCQQDMVPPKRKCYKIVSNQLWDAWTPSLEGANEISFCTRVSFLLTSCWMSLKGALLWIFIGPVCFIIVLNALFIILTAWRLFQKFTSPDRERSILHHNLKSVTTIVSSVCVSALHSITVLTVINRFHRTWVSQKQEVKEQTSAAVEYQFKWDLLLFSKPCKTQF